MISNLDFKIGCDSNDAHELLTSIMYAERFFMFLACEVGIRTTQIDSHFQFSQDIFLEDYILIPIPSVYNVIANENHQS